jgi:hypothetical protein
MGRVEMLRGEERIIIPTHRGEVQIRPFPPLEMQPYKKAGGLALSWAYTRPAPFPAQRGL